MTERRDTPPLEHYAPMGLLERYHLEDNLWKGKHVQDHIKMELEMGERLTVVERDSTWLKQALDEAKTSRRWTIGLIITVLLTVLGTFTTGLIGAGQLRADVTTLQKTVERLVR